MGAAAMVALTKAFEAKQEELRGAYEEAKAARKAVFEANKAAKEEEKTTQLEAVKTQKAEAVKAAAEKAAAEKDAADEKAEIEQEKIAVNKREKIAADAKVSDEKRVTFSKERQDSLEEKIEIERKDFEMKKYIQTTLTAAHTERNNVAGLVQKQVAGLAGAATKVAETIHYIHQNRVDGLNKGVIGRFDGVDARLKQEIQKVDDKFVIASKVTN